MRLGGGVYKTDAGEIGWRVEDRHRQVRLCERVYIRQRTGEIEWKGEREIGWGGGGEVRTDTGEIEWRGCRH